MTKRRITKRAVDAAEPNGADSYLWDDQLSGFGLKVTPAGNKTYLIQYRLGGRLGRTRRVTVGRHGVLTADQARAEAKKLLGDVAAGRDPADGRARAKAELAFGIAVDSFIEQHVIAKAQSQHSRRIPPLNPALPPRELEITPAN